MFLSRATDVFEQLHIWVQLLAANMLKTWPGAFIGFLLAVVGFCVTYAMWSYDQRNDGLYDDLISRGRKLEEELGVDTGIFHTPSNLVVARWTADVESTALFDFLW